MKITTAWTDNGDGEGYSLLSGYSETDFDNWNGVPDWYTKLVKPSSQQEPVRELVIHIPDSVVAALFQPVNVVGTAEG